MSIRLLGKLQVMNPTLYNRAVELNALDDYDFNQNIENKQKHKLKKLKKIEKKAKKTANKEEIANQLIHEKRSSNEINNKSTDCEECQSSSSASISLSFLVNENEQKRKKQKL